MNNKGCICFFNSTKTWGGGEKWHYEMAMYLHAKGYKVLVIVSPESQLSKRLQTKNIPQEKIKISNFSYLNPRKINKVASFYKKHSVYSVIMNSSEDMKLGGLAAKKVELNRVIYRRGSAIPIKNSVINRFFFKKVLTEVLTNSEATKKTINSKNPYLFPKDKITVIPNGIDVNIFDKLDGEKLYTKEDSELLLGNLGRMVFQKNQKFLIEVALELKSRNTNFKILLGGIGRLEKSIKEKIKSHKLEKEIILLGFIDNPKSFMDTIDVFLLPSIWEGFGYVLAEAMLCEKPVIAFDISSNSQLVESDVNGFLVPFNDVKCFCDKIEILNKDLSKTKEMGLSGRNKIQKEFDSEIIYKKVEEYLAF